MHAATHAQWGNNIHKATEAQIHKYLIYHYNIINVPEIAKHNSIVYKVESRNV